MDYEGLRLPFQQVLVENVPSVPLRNGYLSVYPCRNRQRPQWHALRREPDSSLDD